MALLEPAVQDERRTVAVMLGFFFVVHLVAYRALGVHFNATTIDGLWQYLDSALLRGDLLRSLYYLHSQPPAFNFLLGVTLKVFPAGGHVAALNVVYLLCGMALYTGVYLLARRLGVRRSIAFSFATIFLLCPTFILYEHWLFYTFPVATGLCLAALALHSFLRSGEMRWGVAFFGLLFVLCCTWTAFHLGYFLIVAALVAWKWREGRLRTLRAAAVPALLLFALYTKNLVVFGNFGATTWMGMNFAKITVDTLPRFERSQLAKEGVISAVGRIPPFVPLVYYPREYSDSGRFVGIPALSNFRRVNGTNNHNHAGYIAVSRQYMRDAMAVLRRRPEILLQGFRRSMETYAWPGSHYEHLQARHPVLAKVERFYDVVLHGEMGAGKGRWYAGLAFGLPLVWLHGLWTSRARGGFGRPERGALLFMLGTMGLMTLVVNLGELGENNRFRFALDPFYLVLAALFMERIVMRFRGGRSGN